MPPKKPNPKTVIPSPYWTIDKGISFSLLSRFIACRERFRLYAVEGLRETGKQQKAMNFGTYFHKLLEINARDQRLGTHRVIAKTAKFKKIGNSIKPIDRMMANMIYEEYIKWYADTKYRYFDTETTFDVKYPVPGVGKLRLVGKIDQLISWPEGGIYVQENKTKERIQELLMEATIPFNLQTLMYATAAGILTKKPVTGVVYNVIRKPSHRQKNAETDVDFVERVREELIKNPKHFFLRWEYPLHPRRLQLFQEQEFNPLLRSFHIWWESIKNDPFSPWVDSEGLPNPHHYRRPFGVYDSLTNAEGDFFDLIVRNNRVGITEGNNPFSELQEDE